MKKSIMVIIIALISVTGLANTYFKGKPAISSTSPNVRLNRVLFNVQGVGQDKHYALQLSQVKVINKPNSIEMLNNFEILFEGLNGINSIVKFTLKLQRCNHCCKIYPFCGLYDVTVKKKCEYTDHFHGIGGGLVYQK